MKTLDYPLHKQITSLCEQGDHLVNRGAYKSALGKYHKAWDILPEPKEDWEAATWILSAIGDAHFLNRDFKNAIAAFGNAIHCPKGLGNPFIHLRLGESFFELGELPKARDELTRAYMGGGWELFKEEDPKYFGLLKTTLKPPPGQNSI